MYREEMLSRQQLEGENESLRDQLNEAHENTSHIQSHVSELQDKYEECSILLKEAQVCLMPLVLYGSYHVCVRTPNMYIYSTG